MGNLSNFLINRIDRNSVLRQKNVQNYFAYMTLISLCLLHRSYVAANYFLLTSFPKRLFDSKCSIFKCQFSIFIHITMFVDYTVGRSPE